MTNDARMVSLYPLQRTVPGNRKGTKTVDRIEVRGVTAEADDPAVAAIEIVDGKVEVHVYPGATVRTIEAPA